MCARVQMESEKGLSSYSPHRLIFVTEGESERETERTGREKKMKKMMIEDFSLFHAIRCHRREGKEEEEEEEEEEFHLSLSSARHYRHHLARESPSEKKRKKKKKRKA